MLKIGDDQLLTRKEVMHMLNIRADNTFTSIIKQGKLKPMRPAGTNGRQLFWQSEVIKYLHACR